MQRLKARLSARALLSDTEDLGFSLIEQFLGVTALRIER